MTAKLGKQLNFGIDIISFTIICTILTNFSNADPGDVIFVFVYESTIMVLAFALFFLIFNTWQMSKENKNIFWLKSIFRGFFISLTAIISILIVSFILILLLNQITVELLVGFLKDNAFHFKSIELLSESGVYLESETMSKLENLFGKSYNTFFWFLGIKYFINLTIDYFSGQKNRSKDITSFSGLIETASQIIISPIAMLISCIILVILTSIFGSQTWIIFVTLGIFRIIFMLFFSKLNAVLKTI